MKVSSEMPFANECMIGKPVKIGNKVVGKIISVEGNKVTSDIHDEKAYKNIMDGKVPGYSISTADGGLYA